MVENFKLLFHRQPRPQKRESVKESSPTLEKVLDAITFGEAKLSPRLPSYLGLNDIGLGSYAHYLVLKSAHTISDFSDPDHPSGFGFTLTSPDRSAGWGIERHTYWSLDKTNIADFFADVAQLNDHTSLNPEKVRAELMALLVLRRAGTSTERISQIVDNPRNEQTKELVHAVLWDELFYQHHKNVGEDRHDTKRGNVRRLEVERFADAVGSLNQGLRLAEQITDPSQLSPENQRGLRLQKLARYLTGENPLTFLEPHIATIQQGVMRVILAALATPNDPVWRGSAKDIAQLVYDFGVENVADISTLLSPDDERVYIAKLQDTLGGMENIMDMLRGRRIRQSRSTHLDSQTLANMFRAAKHIVETNQQVVLLPEKVEDTVQTETAETSWTFAQLQAQLKKIVVDGQEIALHAFPTYINFGEIAKKTQALALEQKQDEQKLERTCFVGIKHDASWNFMYSETGTGTDSEVTSSASILFDTQELDRLDFAFNIHSHLFGVFSPTDTFIFRTLPGYLPGISIGVAPSEEYGPGFTLYALRSNQTPLLVSQEEKDALTNSKETHIPTSTTESDASDSHPSFLQQLIDQRQKQAERQMVDIYPKEFANIVRTTIKSDAALKSPKEMTPAEAEVLSETYDEIVRSEADLDGFVLYIAPWGSSVAKKCNTAIPLLEQLNY